MQESEGLTDKKTRVDNTDILENAFHHHGRNNRLTHAHTKVAYLNATDQHEVKARSETSKVAKSDQKPNLLSFFKDEGEPVVKRADEEHDKSLNATVPGATFEEYKT